MERHRLAYLKTEQMSNVQRCIVCLSSYSKLANVATVAIPKFIFCFVFLFCILKVVLHAVANILSLCKAKFVCLHKPAKRN